MTVPFILLFFSGSERRVGIFPLFIFILLASAASSNATHTSDAAATSASESSITKELQQKDLCDQLAFCQSNGTNLIFINLSPVDVPVVINQILKQENICKNTNTSCINLGLNNVSLIATSSEKEHLKFADSQELEQINQCEGGTNCLNDGTNQFLVGTSSFGGIPTVSNLNAETKQRLKQDNECTENATSSSKFSTNTITIGTTDFGGRVDVSNTFARINQDLSQINQCSNNTVNSAGSNFNGCDAFGRNDVSIGSVLFEGNSTLSNVDTDVDQKLNEVNKCSNGSQCITFGGNFVSIGFVFLGNSNVNNLDANIKQSIDGVNQCNLLSIFVSLCENSAANLVSLGDSAFGDSNITNIDVGVNQKINHTNDCSSNAECRNDISNQIILGPGSVSNVIIRSDQTSSEANHCKLGKQCLNRQAEIPRIAIIGTNSIQIGTPLFGGATNVSGLDASIKQKTIQSNNCSDSGACLNDVTLSGVTPEGQNSVSIGITIFEGNANVSNVKTNINQFRSEDNTCNIGVVTCVNIGGNNVGIGQVFGSGNATVSNILLIADQSLEEQNLCSIGPAGLSPKATLCNNSGQNSVSIGTTSVFGGNTNVSNVDTNIKQNLLEVNECKGGNKEISSCTNQGSNRMSIGDQDGPGDIALSGLVLSSAQKLEQNNKCENNSTCSNNGLNEVFVVGSSDSGNSLGDNYVTQTGEQTVDKCLDNSNCENDYTNTVKIKEANNNRVVQVIDQDINCRESSDCTNTASNDGTIDGGGQNNQLEMNVRQNDFCLFESKCSNEGQIQSTISGGSGEHVTTSIDQNNHCLRNSSCSNVGSADTNNPSNKQSNTCVNNSECKNGGINNKTVCTNGSNCVNSGTDTKVISNHDDCGNGPDGSTTVCREGSSPIVVVGSSNPASETSDISTSNADPNVRSDQTIQ